MSLAQTTNISSGNHRFIGTWLVWCYANLLHSLLACFIIEVNVTLFCNSICVNKAYIKWFSLCVIFKNTWRYIYSWVFLVTNDYPHDRIWPLNCWKWITQMCGELFHLKSNGTDENKYNMPILVTLMPIAMRLWTNASNMARIPEFST